MTPIDGVRRYIETRDGMELASDFTREGEYVLATDYDALAEANAQRYNQLYDMWTADHRRMVDRGNEIIARAATIAALSAELEAVREALAYALAQHDTPHLFSPMHNHWSAKARAALALPVQARGEKDHG